MTDPAPILEAPPSPEQRRMDRRWMIVSLGLLIGTFLWGSWIAYKLLQTPVPLVAPVDHGPLPEAVRQQVLALIQQDLKNAAMEERWDGGMRDFHISGTPKEELAKQFQDHFKPLVVQRLMPLLRPYGELVSFDIYNMDLPPARLREFPKPQRQ